MSHILEWAAVVAGALIGAMVAIRLAALVAVWTSC